jgi:hypothetical protein
MFRVIFHCRAMGRASECGQQKAPAALQRPGHGSPLSRSESSPILAAFARPPKPACRNRQGASGPCLGAISCLNLPTL